MHMLENHEDEGGFQTHGPEPTKLTSSDSSIQHRVKGESRHRQNSTYFKLIQAKWAFYMSKEEGEEEGGGWGKVFVWVKQGVTQHCSISELWGGGH